MFSSPRRSVDARPDSRSTTPRAGSSTEGRTSPSKSHQPRTLEPLERTTPDKGKGRATTRGLDIMLETASLSPSRSRTVYTLDDNHARSPARLSRTTRGPSAVSAGSGTPKAAARSTSTQAHVPPSASHRSPLPLPSSSRWSTAPTSAPPQHHPPSPRGSTSETLLDRLMTINCSDLPFATQKAVGAAIEWVWVPTHETMLARGDLRLVLALDQLRDRRWREELLVLALRETNVPSTPETDKRKMLLLAWKALVKWEQKEMGGQKRWLGGEVWAVVWEMVPRSFPYLDREEGKGFRLVTPDLGPNGRSAERWIRQLDPPQGGNGHHLHASARASSLVSASPSICSTASGQSTPIEVLSTPPRRRDFSASVTPRRNAGVSQSTASPPNRLSQIRQSQKSGSSREDAIDIEDNDSPPVIHIDEDSDEVVDLEVPPSQRPPASQKTDTSFGLSSDITASQANAVDRVEQEWTQQKSYTSQHPLAPASSRPRIDQPTSSQLRAVEEEEASNDDDPIFDDFDFASSGGEEAVDPVQERLSRWVNPEDGFFDEHEDVVLSPPRRGSTPDEDQPDDGASEDEDAFEREETFLTADESPEVDGEETQLNEKLTHDLPRTNDDLTYECVALNKIDDPVDDAMDLDDDPDATAIEGPSQMSSSRYSSSQATSPEPPLSLFDGPSRVTLSGSDIEPKLATVQVYRGRDSFHYLWCQVEETGESSTSPKLELMVAAVNKIEKTANWVSALDGERVTVQFGESWDAFLAVFQSLFESGPLASPSRKVVIDLLVADEDDMVEDGIEDEEVQPAQSDADMDDEPAYDDESSGPDDDFEAEMDDAQRIEDYLMSEPQAAEPDVEIELYSLDVTIYSFTLPRPPNASTARPFKPPSKCALRISVLRHFEGAETVVTRQHHTSLLSPWNPCSSDGTIFLSSPLNLHVDSSVFAALDPAVPSFAGQLGLPPASALVLHVEFVQLADAGGRPSRWFLEAFGSDSFDAVRLPEAKIRLASRTQEGELVRGGVGEDGEGSAALRLRGEPVRDGWLDLRTDWIEEGLGMGVVAEEEVDEEEEETAPELEAEDQDAPAALMSEGEDLTDDEDVPAFKYIQGGQEPGFYAAANASSTAPVASVIRHAITLARCGVDCARLNDFLVVKPADGSLADEAIRNMSFDWRTGRGLVAVTENEVNAVKTDMARYTSFTNWCSTSNRYFIVCPLDHVVKCNVVFGGQINTYKMANHHFGPNMTKFHTKQQQQDDLSKKRKADEPDEDAARPSTIRRFESPEAPSPEPASAASPPLVWPSSSPVAAIASPKVVVQPPSSSIGPPLSQQHVDELPQEDRFLGLVEEDAGSSTSVGSASPSYLSTEAPTDDTDEMALHEHRPHALPSRLPSVSVSTDIPPILSAPPSPAEEIENEVIETITEEVSRTVITSESTSYSSATSKTTTIVAGPSRLPHLAASSLLSISAPASLVSSRSRSTSVLGTPPSLLDALTPEQRARTLSYDPQTVDEVTFPLVEYRPDVAEGAKSQRVLGGTFADALEGLEKVSGDRSWRMRERDEAIFDLEGHHEGQKLVMCAWNRWVEKNAPTRIHRKIARKYTLGFVREYFDFLDKFGLHAFFVVHMTTLRTFELIDSKVFALALGRWGTLKRAKTQRAAQSDSLAQPIHGDQLPVVLGDPTDSSRYPDMSWLFD